MMGHMNVMWYTHLFGRATCGLFLLVGHGRSYSAPTTPAALPSPSSSATKEVRAGEHVTLRSRLVARSSRQFHVIHFMTKGDEQMLAATGEFLAAHIDMHARRMSPFAPHIAENLDRILAEHSQLDWPPPLSGAIQVR